MGAALDQMDTCHVLQETDVKGHKKPRRIPGLGCVQQGCLDPDWEDEPSCCPARPSGDRLQMVDSCAEAPIDGAGGDAAELLPRELSRSMSEILGLVAGPVEEECRRALTAGASMCVDGEPVVLLLDPELQCLEVREHEMLYPLAELRDLQVIEPRQGSDTYELSLQFAELADLVFQFDEDADRAFFAEGIRKLAEQAREGNGCYVMADSDEGSDGEHCQAPLLGPNLGQQEVLMSKRKPLFEM